MSDVLDWYKRKQEEQKLRSLNRVKPQFRATFYSNDGKPMRKGAIAEAKRQAEEQQKAREAEEALQSIYEKPELVAALEKK